jgi:hypothetical protein
MSSAERSGGIGGSGEYASARRRRSASSSDSRYFHGVPIVMRFTITFRRARRAWNGPIPMVFPVRPRMPSASGKAGKPKFSSAGIIGRWLGVLWGHRAWRAQNVRPQRLDRIHRISL